MSILICDRSLSECDNKKNFYGIDITKFICSILVIAIHISPFANNSKFEFLNFYIQNYIARIAVPFFFMSSGYLIFRKYKKSNNNKIAIKASVKFVRMYLIWTFIYSYFIIENIIFSDKGVIREILAYIRNFFFVGSYYHLWYLPACAFAIILVSFFLEKKMDIKYIVMISAFFYFLGLFSQSYYGLILPLRNISFVWKILKIIQKIIVTTRDGLFQGFFFVSLGMYFAYRPINIQFRKAVEKLVLSLFLFFLEVVVLKHFNLARGYDMYIMLIPCSFYLFYIVTHIELNDRKIYIILRSMSGLIYVMHFFIRNVIYKIFDLVGSELIDNTSILFILTVITSCIVSFIIINIFNTKNINKIY